MPQCRRSKLAILHIARGCGQAAFHPLLAPVAAAVAAAAAAAARGSAAGSAAGSVAGSAAAPQTHLVPLVTTGPASRLAGSQTSMTAGMMASTGPPPDAAARQQACI